MPTLWNSLCRRWLDPGGPAADAAPNAERLCDHLRRDIGLENGEDGPFTAEYIRDRNYSGSRTFLMLQAYR